MGKSTLSISELLPSAESARVYLEGQRWPNGPACPACGERDRIWYDAKRPGYYRCNADLLVFTVRTGTIFERSKVPLHKWLYAMYLLTTAEKSISSPQLAKQIGVTQKSAWFMLQRLREVVDGETIRVELDAVTARVFAYRPKNKGKWAEGVGAPLEACHTNGLVGSAE